MVGEGVGSVVGMAVGLRVGFVVGRNDGEIVGWVGVMVGEDEVGIRVGPVVGRKVSPFWVGRWVGVEVGVRDSPARMLWETVSAKRRLPLLSIETPLGFLRVA